MQWATIIGIGRERRDVTTMEADRVQNSLELPRQSLRRASYSAANALRQSAEHDLVSTTSVEHD